MVQNFVAVCAAILLCYWCVARGGDTDPPEYDDYYDHDVSGLLEDD